MSTDTAGNSVAWIPLESNPEVMTKYLWQLGVPPSWQISDVYGLDDELLTMVPQPCKALMLLYPMKTETKGSEETEPVKSDGQEVSPQVYYMKQTVSNACGTVALIHCIANNPDAIKLESGSLKDFLAATKDLSPEERGQKLGSSSEISAVHEESAQEGQTDPSQTSVDYHFVAFVHVDGSIYEFDGRKDGPVNHGKSSDATFLRDAAAVCRSYIARDPEELRFTVVALSQASS